MSPEAMGAVHRATMDALYRPDTLAVPSPTLVRLKRCPLSPLYTPVKERDIPLGGVDHL